MAQNPGKFLYQWDPSITGAVKGAALGNAPSMAEQMLRAAYDKAMRQTTGIMATQRNVPAAMGARMGLQAQSGLQSQAANQAGQLRAQEMAGARGEAVGMLGQQQQGWQQAWQQQQAEEQAKKQRMDQWLQMLIGGGMQAGGALLGGGL
jgi:hypothetical protein